MLIVQVADLAGEGLVGDKHRHTIKALHFGLHEPYVLHPSRYISGLHPTLPFP